MRFISLLLVRLFLCFLKIKSQNTYHKLFFRSRESGGTGLGLSIAREILSQHKGEIKIDSVYGEGTDVRITLPAAPPEK